MRKNYLVLTFLAIAIVVGAVFYWANPPNGAFPSKVAERVVINEAARTLLYLPVYDAIEKGYFAKEYLDVHIETGGTATAAFSAMLTGHADFALADPMYVPISRAKGAQTKVIAQVVGRVALWALTTTTATAFDEATIKGKTISTHIRPMTAFTYTENYVRGLGLMDGTDVTILQSRPGTEITPLLTGKAQFAVTIEPGASTAETAGAHVVYSWPQALGDRVFSALMTTNKEIQERHAVVVKVVRALDHALVDLHNDPDGALSVAQKYFPQLDAQVLKRAIDRLSRQRVFADTPMISPASWNAAVEARRKAGDLIGPAPYEQDFDAAIVSEALAH